MTSTAATPTTRPTGRDEVRDAILHAAGQHFATAGTSASLRDIAADAGVNLGLIHRHFGNKDDLLRAVLAQHAARGVAVATEAADTTEAVRSMFTQTLERDQYIRIVAWLLLAGTPVADIQSHYPSMRALRDRAASEGIDELDVLATFALLYGWTVFGPQLLAAFDRHPRDRPAVEVHLQGALQRLLAP